MKKSALNFILLITFLTLCSCASGNYEWVKINTDKINKAKTAQPHSENIRYVDVKVNAKYKAENITYVENSADYFTSQNISTLVEPKKRIVRTPRVFKANNTAKKVISQPADNHKVIDKPIAKTIIKNNAETESLEDAEAMNKLNSGLIMPKKKKQLIEDKPLFEDVAAQVKSNQKPVVEEVLVKPKAEEHLSYDNGLGQLEDQDVELNNRELKDSSLEPLSDNQIKEEGVKRNSYMWIGLVLLIIGLIIGLIFGGLAYFISVVGLVFLLIGYLTRT